jgi:hypothetical protein
MQRDLPRQQAKKILVWMLQWLYRRGQNMTESSPRRGTWTDLRLVQQASCRPDPASVSLW